MYTSVLIGMFTSTLLWLLVEGVPHVLFLAVHVRLCLVGDEVAHVSEWCAVRRHAGSCGLQALASIPLETYVDPLPLGSQGEEAGPLLLPC